LRRIEGRHNPLIRELRQTFSHGGLNEDRDFPIVGPRLVEEAARGGIRFRAIFFANTAGNKGQPLVPQVGRHHVKMTTPDKDCAAAVPSETPQGVAALVRGKEWRLDAVLERASVGPIVAIAGVQDPGNVGTILRSAEAFGAGGVLVGEGTVSPYNPKVV